MFRRGSRVHPEPPQEEQPEGGQPAGGEGGGQPGGGGNGGHAFRVKVGVAVILISTIFGLILFIVLGSDHQTGDTPPPT
ncbi:hypothetical protein L195_g034254 [Trifolium pratense]|uniref:Uncharacterized protein n=1 Tax=Trifolium pratense TaxID=57577 RepID=A0A2K3LIB6_TRIPR|nr:hypothetical protein L195_g034254 [Trifolium pratense]